MFHGHLNYSSFINPFLVYFTGIKTVNIVKAEGVYSPLYSLGVILAAKETKLLVRDYIIMVICGKALGVSW